MCDCDNITELFELSDGLLSPLFEGLRYPFEALPRICDYILENRRAWLSNGFIESSKGVFIHRSASISNLAVIRSPALIMANAQISEFAKLKGGVIVGEGAFVGSFSEIKNSVLFPHAKVPHLNYVGDSMLGNFAHIGAGVKCSNLRSDERSVCSFGVDTNMRKVGAFIGDRAEIGCNSVICPGVSVGKHAVVYPLTLVKRDVKRGCVLKCDGEIKEGLDICAE